jgi:hypothetical protein
MNSKHYKTLVAIFTDPVNGNLGWHKIEALFIALGCEIVEGNGSRVTFIYIKWRTRRFPPSAPKQHCGIGYLMPEPF